MRSAAIRVQAAIGEHADPRLVAGRLNANDQTVAFAGPVPARKPERPLRWHIGQPGRTELELPSERPVALNIPTNRLAADHDPETRSANCEFEGTGRVLQPVPVAERPQVKRDVVPRISTDLHRQTGPGSVFFRDRPQDSGQARSDAVRVSMARDVHLMADVLPQRSERVVERKPLALFGHDLSISPRRFKPRHLADEGHRTTLSGEHDGDRFNQWPRPTSGHRFGDQT